jgi:Zn-dependent peptidase ImmA (M78 family)/DNA-binding XRE family transcriptional regulator
MTKQYAHINHKLLVWARESAGYRIKEAAKKIGTPTHRLISWEKGELEPTLIQLRKVADVYKRPSAIFYLKTPPEDIRIPHDFRRYPTEPERSISPPSLFEIRKAHFRRNIALRLSEYISDIPQKIINTATLNSNIEDLAFEIRKLLDVSLGKQFAWNRPDHSDALNYWIDVIENLGILVFQTAYPTKIPEEYKREISGFCIKEKEFPAIVVNRNDWKNRRIFTLMHEMAHLMLDTESMCDLKEYEDYLSDDQKVEIFCNEFAASVLVPKNSFLNEPLVLSQTQWEDNDIKQLSDKYSISREVIVRRLLSFKRVTRDFYLKKRDEYDDFANQLREKREIEKRRMKEKDKTSSVGETTPQKIIRTNSRLFQSIVLSAYYHEEITSCDLAEYVGVDIKHLDKIEKRVFTGRI